MAEIRPEIQAELDQLTSSTAPPSSDAIRPEITQELQGLTRRRNRDMFREEQRRAGRAADIANVGAEAADITGGLLGGIAIGPYVPEGQGMITTAGRILNKAGDILGGVTRDVMAGQVTGSRPFERTFQIASGQTQPEAYRYETEGHPIAEGIVSGAESLPVIAAGAVAGPELAPAVMSLGMGASTYARTQDPVEAWKSAAIGAVLPPLAQGAKVAAAGALGKAAEYGIIPINSTLIQKGVETVASQAAMQGLLLGSNIPEYMKLSPEELKNALIRDTTANMAFGLLEIPGLIGGPSETQRRTSAEKLAGLMINEMANDPTIGDSITRFSAQQIGRLPTTENQPGIIAEGPTRTTVWRGQPRPIPIEPLTAGVTHATTEGPLTGGFPTEYERILAGQNVSPNAGPLWQEPGYQAGGGGGVRPEATQPVGRPLSVMPEELLQFLTLKSGGASTHDPTRALVLGTSFTTEALERMGLNQNIRNQLRNEGLLRLDDQGNYALNLDYFQDQIADLRRRGWIPKEQRPPGQTLAGVGEPTEAELQPVRQARAERMRAMTEAEAGAMEGAGGEMPSYGGAIGQGAEGYRPYRRGERTEDIRRKLQQRSRSFSPEEIERRARIKRQNLSTEQIRADLQKRSRSATWMPEADRARARRAPYPPPEPEVPYGTKVAEGRTRRGFVSGSKAEQWANDVMNRPDVKKKQLIGYPLWGDAQRLSAAVVIGISHLERGIINFANWSKAMLRDLGKLSTDDLKRLWDLSHTRLNWLMREPDWVRRDKLTSAHMQIGALHDEYDTWMEKNYSRQEAALLSQIQEHMKDSNLPNAARMVFSDPQRFLEMVYRKRRVPREYRDAVNVIRDLADQDPELRKAFDEMENSRQAFITAKLKQLGYSGFEIQNPMTWKSSRANIYNRSPGLGLMIDEYMGYDGPETKNLPGYETLESGRNIGRQLTPFKPEQLMDSLGLKTVRILNNPGRAIREAMDENGMVAGDTIGKWISQQLPEEWGIYQQAGFEDFLKSKPRFTLPEVQQWLMENGPKVEVREFGGANATKEEQRHAQLTHEWFDNLPDVVADAVNNYVVQYRKGPSSAEVRKLFGIVMQRARESGTVPAPNNVYAAKESEKFADTVEEYAKLRTLLVGPNRPQTINVYPTVAPSNLPIKLVMVRVPTARLEVFNNDRNKWAVRDKDGKQIKEFNTQEEAQNFQAQFQPKHTGGHFGDEDRNVLGWARIQMETTPDGRRIAHIIELQSDWAQQKRDYEAKYQKLLEQVTKELGPRFEKYTVQDENGEWVYRAPNHELGQQLPFRAGKWATKEQAIDSLIKAQVEASTTLRPPQVHPLLRDHQRLVLKAAIDQAIKDGATHIAISDAETAMMSEGHDLAKGTARYFTTKSEAQAWLNEIGKTGEVIKEEGRPGRWMARPIEIKQEPGMRFNYDRELPRLLSELTGDAGVKESFGPHMRAFKGIEPDEGSKELLPEYEGANKTRIRKHTGRYWITDERPFEGSRLLTEADFDPTKTGLSESAGEFYTGRYGRVFNSEAEAARFIESFNRTPPIRSNLIFESSPGVKKTDRSATVFGLEQAKQTLEQTGGASLIGRTLESGRVLAEEFGELDHLLKPGVTAEQLLNEVSRIAPEFRAVIEALQEAGIKPRVVSVSSLKSPTTGKEVGGLYDRATNTIYLRRFANDQTGTFIEEMVHAATVEAYHNKSRAGEAFRAELSQILKRLREKVHDPDQFYYLENELEMLAGAYVDPVVRNLMKSVKAEGGTTVWSKFVSAVKDVWRSIFGGRTETILDRVLKLSQENFKPNEVLPKDMAALEGKLRDPNDRERLLAAHEAVRAGQGMDVVKQAAASSLIGQNPAIQRTISALKLLSTQPLTPGEIQENPALRDIKEASQRLLKQVDWMAREVEGMSWASDKLGNSLQRFMDYRTNPNISEAEKSAATGQALKEMDEFNREYGKFRVESDKEEQTLKSDLDEAVKSHNWEIAATEAAKTLTEELKQTGKALAAAAQDKGAIALANKMSSNTTALEHATQFIATFADHFLIQNGTIRTTKDLMSHLESIAQRNGQTLEQAAGANRETVQWVASLVLQSEPYRNRLFEASDLFRDKAASYPLKPFMQKIAEHVQSGNYEAAMDAFGKGVGNTAVELNRSRKAARLFGRQIHNMVVRLREIQQLRRLYDAARMDPDYQAARDTVYHDLNVDAITHGTDDTPTFRVKGIKPGDPDTTIDFGSTGKIAEENMAKWNDLKEKIANYLANPNDPDYSPAKANALRKLAAQMELWANPTVNPRVSRLVPNFLDVLPNTFFGVLGKAGSVPDVIHRYLGGWGADYANATFTALRTVKQQVDAIQNVHIPRLESALKKAMKSHGMRSGDMRAWEDKIWTPLVASTQYFENPLQHNKVGARLSTGHQVTAEDLIYLKRWREFDKALRSKLDQRNEASRSILKRFRSGVVEEAPEGGMRVRDAVETGPATVSRRIGGRIYQLARDFLEAPTMNEKIRVLNANWDKLMAGYLEDSTGFSFRHSYRFHDEIKAAYLQRRQQGKTINNFHDLVNEITDRYNNTHDGEPIERADVVTALVPEIGGLFKKLLDEQKRLDSLKTRVKVFGGENAFNTARGEQIFPSTWYDYGSVSAADHAAHGGTSTSKFYFDHLKAVETLYRSLDKLVKDFESDQALLHNAKKAKQEGTNYYDYHDAKKARDLVGDYYNKLSSVLNEDVLRAIGQRQGLVGAGMEYSLASILGGPAAMTFNSFGGLHNIAMADAQITGRSFLNSAARTGARASWLALKNMASFIGTKENKVGRIIRKIVESGKGAPLINQFFKAYHDFLMETDQQRERGREEGFSTASNMGEVRQAMWDWKVNGGAAGETPPDQSLLNKLKQTGVAGLKYAGRSISNKTLRNIDAFLNQLGKQLIQDIQEKYEARARNYGTLRAEAARREGRDPFDPTDIRNQFSSDELMKRPGMVRNTDVEATREREWFKRAADINLDARMMDYVKRREEARAAGRNPEEVRLFTPQEMNQLMYAAATRVNLGDFGNRPLTFKAGNLGRFAGLLLGYRINQVYKMVSALDGLHREPFFKRYKAAMPTFVMMLAAAAIWGAMGMQARSGVKQMMNQATGEPTVFGSQSGSDLANAMAVGAAQIMPLYGDIYNYATGNAYKTGWDLNNQFVLLNMATDVVKMMKQTWQSGDATYPMINFARRWTFPANWAGGYLPQVAGLQEFTNTRTYLNRAARDLGMETRLGKTSNFTGQNWGPTTPILNEFANAVGKGDTAGAKSAFDSLVRYYTEQGLDPKEARQRALSGIRTRNPLTQVFGSALTMGQLDQLYGRMNERERKIVGRALGNYESIVGQLGASTAMTKEARQTAKLRRVGRTARPTGIAGRIIGRATRAGRRVRNPLQRINRRLGIRQPRMKRTRTVIA